MLEPLSPQPSSPGTHHFQNQVQGLGGEMCLRKAVYSISGKLQLNHSQSQHTDTHQSLSGFFIFQGAQQDPPITQLSTPENDHMHIN